MDRARITVRSGKGGAGCVSFRREKYIPRGGPDGGDGGRGGDVVITAGDQRETLLRYRFNQRFAARNGKPGEGRNRTGESASGLVLKVPPGTAVLDAASGGLLADLARPGDSYTACRGGRGGQGNARFASGGMRAPRFAQPGGDCEEKEIVLELRLTADAALVGYPNVGKSSLVSRLSAATPKIADYPFTTLSPVLGAVRVDEDSSYVLADLPGLIDGASEGLGLGHEFLRHVSRARALVHLLDPTRLDPENPLRDYEAIRGEIRRHDPSMLEKPALLALGKMDLPEGPAALEALRRSHPGLRVLPFSSVTGEGLDSLRYAVWEEVKRLREREAATLEARDAKRSREEAATAARRGAPGKTPGKSPAAASATVTASGRAAGKTPAKAAGENPALPPRRAAPDKPAAKAAGEAPARRPGKAAAKAAGEAPAR
ncbi:MAG: GTPase ObgE [Deltaproteobacteria bacterium]|nr:GTPase ObgE [Deltaproteobacteria bacterium]